MTWIKASVLCFITIIIIVITLWSVSSIRSPATFNAKTTSSAVQIMNPSSRQVVSTSTNLTSNPIVSESSSNSGIQRKVLYTDGTPSEYTVVGDQLYLNNADGSMSDISTNRNEAWSLVNPSSFYALSDSQSGIYFKDGKHVYVDTAQSFSLITGADASTFQVVRDESHRDTEYGVDATHVFDDGNLVLGADPASLVVQSADSVFFYDGQHVWCHPDNAAETDQIVPGASPSTFIDFPAPDGSPSVYGHDSTNVYCCAAFDAIGKLQGADIHTFLVDSVDAAHDDKQTYYDCLLPQ